MKMFKHIFTPIKIGNMEVKNRIVLLPMTTGYPEADETVGYRFINFYVERAKGGAGFIIIPFSPVRAGSSMEPGLFDDRFIPGVRRLTEGLHGHGAKVACQLIVSYHVIFKDGMPEVVGPSPVMNQIVHAMPRALTVDEIHFIVEEYGRTARRAREGGVDAVEILVGCGYLLNRFLSPFSNKREDEYGGDLENRMRMILECIASVRKEAGNDFPVGVRLNIEELMPGGHTVEDSMIVAKVLEKAANRINDPFVAEKILVDGKADLVGMARSLIADPEFPNKAKEGRVEEIVPCIACSRCLAEIFPMYKAWGKRFSVLCTVNPVAGKEGESSLEPTAKQKKVVVIGGGPGGMEAAMTAAMRGHRVTLFEKEDELGGCLRIGCIPPHKDEIRTLNKSLVARTQKAGVKIKLKSKAGLKTIEKEKPDVLILSVGAKPIVPNIPGVKGAHVALAEDVLMGRKSVSGAVIIVGGGLVGCETAEFLIEHGQGITSVTIVEMLERMAETVPPTYRPFFLARLKRDGVRMKMHTTVAEVTDKGVKVVQDGKPGFIEGDAVILALGFKADPQRTEQFKRKAREVYFIGDCVKARMIKDAIEEGFEVGRKI